jgi:cysteine desulfurase / selenocysteine lyase
MSGTAAATPRDGQLLDLDAVRADFPILHQEVDGKPLAYLDNAASTQKPEAVVEAIATYYRRDHANVHRGLHELARRATEAYEASRATVAGFIGASDPAELVFTRGATEAINLVAWAWGSTLREGDEILLSVMEHHSNLVPWQMVAQRTGAKLRFLQMDDEGRLDLSGLDTLLTDRTRLVSLAYVSNALGTIHPVREIGRRAREAGALMLVDGAQATAHLPLDVADLECDFFAFSGHKMLGPTGIGGLWGRREVLESMPPFHGGGEMIRDVELERSTYTGIPGRFEAGTPDMAGAVGLAAAVRYLEGMGLDAVHRHEHDLVTYALDKLGEVPDLVIYGPRIPAERSGVVSFTMGDVHPHDLATILDTDGIAIRAGHHCCQPLMRCLGVSSTARASVSVYNTRQEIDRLVESLHHARRLFGY